MQRIGKQIRITVTDLQEERVQAIAKKHNISKANVYRNTIDVGLDLYDDLERMGAVQITEIGTRAKEIFKHWKARKQRKLF